MILVVAEQREAAQSRHVGDDRRGAAVPADGPVKVAVLGSGVGRRRAAELAAADVAEVVVVDAAPLDDYTADGYVAALAAADRRREAVAGASCRTPTRRATSRRRWRRGSGAPLVTD